MSVSATATINTFFIGLLPQFKTLNVSSTAQARFARVIMTLVLDRSGSMNQNAPGTSLPDAVTLFIDQFDNVNDSVSMVSFATDWTIDVSMRTGGFQAAITDAAKNMSHNFLGATWSDGALQQAITQEGSLTLPANVVHVVVFFTDGNANTIQDTLTCKSGSLSSGTWNFGGYDNPSDGVGYFTPNTNPTYPVCEEPPNSCCSSPGTFPSHSHGKAMPINFHQVNSDADYRARQVANNMRAATPPIIVYAIGLQGPGGSANKVFLCEIANDPTCSPTFDSTQPAGQMVMASDSTQLNSAFLTIASEIRLRLLR
jgi:hypothetical protein